MVKHYLQKFFASLRYLIKIFFLIHNIDVICNFESCHKFDLVLSPCTLQMFARTFGKDIFLKGAACHGDEILMLFKSCAIPMEGRYSRKDKKVSNYLLQFWTNFVKTGEPTEIWPNLQKKGHQRLVFESDGSLNVSTFDDSLTESWMKLYEKNPPRVKVSDERKYCTRDLSCDDLSL